MKLIKLTTLSFLMLIVLNCRSQFTYNYSIGSGIAVNSLENKTLNIKGSLMGVPIQLKAGVIFSRVLSAELFFSTDFIFDKNEMEKFSNSNNIFNAGLNLNFLILGSQDIGNALYINGGFGIGSTGEESNRFLRLGITGQTEVFNENFLFASVGNSFYRSKNLFNISDLSNRLDLIVGLKFTIKSF